MTGNGHVARIGTQTINACLKIPQEKTTLHILWASLGKVIKIDGDETINSDLLTCHSGGTNTETGVSNENWKKKF